MMTRWGIPPLSPIPPGEYSGSIDRVRVIKDDYILDIIICEGEHRGSLLHRSFPLHGEFLSRTFACDPLLVEGKLVVIYLDRGQVYWIAPAYLNFLRCT